MDLKKDFSFSPQPPLAPKTSGPPAQPSAGEWATRPQPQLHPAPPPAAFPTHPAGSTGSAPAPAQGTPGAHTPTPAPIPAAPQPAPHAPAGPPAMPTSPAAPVVAKPPATPTPAPVHPAPIQAANGLGPLAALLGKWTGEGFNVIWRPHNGDGSDRFLELDRTIEDIEFVEIPGDIPNRGLLQGDISMKGLRYLQQIKDANTGAGLHIEPGIWATVPATANPAESETVVRMASIPHGTTILAQGIATVVDGPPPIVPASIAPFLTALPNQPMDFDEMHLDRATQFRTPKERLGGVSQDMLTDPNSILVEALRGHAVKRTTSLIVSTAPSPVIGGGTANTAFLQGGSGGPNAMASLVTAVFWIEEIAGTAGQPDSVQIQYSQTVFLDFNGVRWPHVSVATLRKEAPAIS